MPFSTIGPFFSRLAYGRGSRSLRIQCFLVTVMLLPLGMLFYYSVFESASSDSMPLEGHDDPDHKFRRNLQHVENGFDAKKAQPLDPVLEKLIKSKSIRTKSPIPDTRPNDCIASPADDSVPDAGVLARRLSSIHITIAIIPDHQKYATRSDYELTLASIIATTETFFDNLEIAFVVNDVVTSELIKYFDQLKEAKRPVIYTVKPSKSRKTLFHELLELGKQFKSEALVYLTSGVECNAGWLEAMIAPMLSPPAVQSAAHSPSTAATQSPAKDVPTVIVTPHFDRIRPIDGGEKKYEPETEFIRLSFHWNLKPMWYEMPFEELLQRNSEAEVIAAPVFLPHVFAVNISSSFYSQLYSHFEERATDDATTFEAAQYIWRCLNGAVIISPCARVASPNGYFQPEFDPKLVNVGHDDLKKRIIDTWFDEYRPTALRLLHNVESNKIEGRLDDDSFTPRHCSRNFHWYLKTVSKEVVIPEDCVAFGWLKSGGGGCFRAAIEHRLLGGPCSVLSDAHIFFLQKDGVIRTRTGLCLSAPDQLSYIELVECDSKDPKQHWIYGPDGTIKAVTNKNRCLMHATDPDEEKRARQILMLYNCMDVDKEYAPFQKFSFTYKII